MPPDLFASVFTKHGLPTEAIFDPHIVARVLRLAFEDDAANGGAVPDL